MKKINILLVAICVIIFHTGCKFHKTSVATLSKKKASEEQIQSIKDYALCKCLFHIAPNDTAVINDISVGVYRDITGFDLSLYEKVDKMADSAFNAIEPSQIADYSGRKAYMMSCIEFSRSKRLDALIRSYRPLTVQ